MNRGKWLVNMSNKKINKMKRYIHILFILTLWSQAGFAQQLLSVRLENRPMTALFDAIEKQTDYRIYIYPEISDSTRVTINETSAEPVEIIRKALQNTDYQLSTFQNSIYIIKDKTLITSLPESFYRRTRTGSDDFIPVFERETKATSETLLYAIGNPNVSSASTVTMTGVVTNFKNGEPIPGVNLLLDDSSIGSVTDHNGFYTIRLPAGRQELFIRGMGIKETKRQLMLFSDGKLDIEIEDNVFLLSVDEALSYFGKSRTVPNTNWSANDDRLAKPTAYVKTNGTYDPVKKKYLGGYTDRKAGYYKGKDYIVSEEFTGCMDWYLRSVGTNDIALNATNTLYHHGQLSYVTFLGAICAGGVLPKALSFGIRPAIVINN